MDIDFTVTSIDHVIFVSKNEYPEERSRFPADLRCNEMVYDFSGEYVLYLGEKVIDFRPGCIRVMAQGDHGRYEVLRRTHGDCVDVFFRTAEPLAKDLYVGNYAANHRLDELFRRIFSVWVAKHPGYRAECMATLYQILSQLQQESDYLGANGTDKIKPAVTYIEENFNKEEISCDKLAALCGISYSYLKQLFVKRYHRSPKQYLLRLRLNYACDLLLSGQCTVGQAAQMSGFPDPYFFSKFFKKNLGLSPTEYQKKFRSSK